MSHSHLPIWNVRNVECAQLPTQQIKTIHLQPITLQIAVYITHSTSVTPAPGSRAAETFLPASSKEVQQQFFQMVGICEDIHGMEETETPVLTHEEALLMSTALQHEPKPVSMGFEHPDPYFTEEEFEKYLEKLMTVHMDMCQAIQSRQLLSVDSTTVYNSTLRETCHCVAHASELSWVKELIDVDTPINEYSGGIIATFVLQRILANTRTNVTVEKCTQGSPFSVAYAIRTADAKEAINFSGWPDHTFLSPPVDAGQRRILVLNSRVSVQCLIQKHRTHWRAPCVLKLNVTLVTVIVI